MDDGQWSITEEGEDFLRFAASRASIVKSVFVYNEPYWIDPFTEQQDPCGALTAEELRGLRDAIREVWPQALVHHDIGTPSKWAPGGSLASQYPCLGEKYADQTGVADLVGIWYYPFAEEGDFRETSLVGLREEVAFVREKMNAEPLVSGQAFRCSDCGEASRFPSAEELLDWHCSLRLLEPHAITWYPWRQARYEDYLSNHPELWPLTRPDAPCGLGVVLAAGVNSASNSFGSVSEEMIVALYGTNLARETLVAGPPPLPNFAIGEQLLRQCLRGDDRRALWDEPGEGNVGCRSAAAADRPGRHHLLRHRQRGATRLSATRPRSTELSRPLRIE